MRKGLLVLLGLAAAASMPPGAALAQAPLKDSASGSGHVLQTDFFGAGEAGPNGEDPVGWLTLSGYLNFTTVTTCLNVSENAVVGGGRIVTGRGAGRGFLSSSVDNGPPVNGRPVDVTVYSGRLPSPPRHCPSPGDAPPPEMSPTGGGPFTSGDITVVDATERLPSGAPRARVALLSVGPGRGGPLLTGSGLNVRVRVCGAAGIALLRFTEASSPSGRNSPVWTRTSWQDEHRQGRRCAVHRVSSPRASSGAGRHRVTVRARTTGRRWSRPAVRVRDSR